MPKRKRKNEDGSKKEVKKYKGVRKQGERFQARIRIDGKDQSLGWFDTAKEAARAYDHAAMQAGHPPTTLNFQDKVPIHYKSKKKKLLSNNTTGFKGVSKRGDRFSAQIYSGSKIHNVGYFGTPKEAAIAYDCAAIQAGRPKSDLNFPDMDESTSFFFFSLSFLNNFSTCYLMFQYVLIYWEILFKIFFI